MWRVVYRIINTWAASLSHNVVQYNYISPNTIERLTNLFVDHDCSLDLGVAAILVNVRRHLDEIKQLYIHIATNYNKYGEIHWGTSYSFELNYIVEIFLSGYIMFGDDFHPSIWSHYYLYGQDWHTNSDVEGILNSESDLDDDSDDGDEHPVNSW